jgi:hypothetical protein
MGKHGAEGAAEATEWKLSIGMASIFYISSFQEHVEALRDVRVGARKEKELVVQVVLKCKKKQHFTFCIGTFFDKG